MFIPRFTPARWLLIAGIACAVLGSAGPGALAREPENAAAPAAQEPIALEPSRDAAPAPVHLGAEKSDEPWTPREIGEFTLVDQDGNRVTKEDLLGKPWVASFIFTRCAISCPNLVRKIYDLNQSVRDVDVRFVTLTVDPEFDTVARMKQYSEIYQAEPERWLFLTGDKEEMTRLIRYGFQVAAWEVFGTARAPGFEFAHSLSLVHVGPDGQVLGTYGSSDEAELKVLERVLKGEMETPREHRPVPPGAVPEGQSPSSVPPPFSRADAAGNLPAWAARLPRTNAMLNGLAAVLLLTGFAAIRAGRVTLHMRLMLFSFGISVVFLASYLTYHIALRHFTGSHGKPFEGVGAWRPIYYGLLISHVVLAAAVPVLTTVTIYRALTQQFERHKRIARITFPIWLYVSVTGVIIYGMLYHWPAS